MATPGKLKPLDGDQTFVDVIVRRGAGRTYHKRRRISSMFDHATIDHLSREVEYSVALAGREIRRDILWNEQPRRPTNPFSWSPGPTRWQFYK